MLADPKIDALLKDLAGYDVTRCYRATVELKKYGAAAAEPLAEIIRHSKNQVLVARAITALAGTRTPLAREVLLECLKSTDISNPASAAYELVNYIDEPGVFEALAATLKGDNYFLISISVFALGESRLADGVVARLAMVAQECPNSNARCAAMYAMINLPPLRSFLPVLERLEGDQVAPMTVKIAARQLRRNWETRLMDDAERLAAWHKKRKSEDWTGA